MADATVPTNTLFEQWRSRARLIAPYPTPEPPEIAERNAAVVDEWRFSDIGLEELATKHEMAPEDVLALLERTQRSRVPRRNLLIFEEWNGKKFGIRGISRKYDISPAGICAILSRQQRKFSGRYFEVRGCGGDGGDTGSNLSDGAHPREDRKDSGNSSGEELPLRSSKGNRASKFNHHGGSDSGPQIYLRRGSPYYQARLIRQDGTSKRVSTSSADEDVAREIAIELQKDLNLNESPGALLFSLAHSAYIKSCSLRKATINNYNSSHRIIKATLGDFSMNLLTPAAIESYVKTRQSGKTTQTIRRDLAYLSSLFRWYMAQPDGPLDNPLRHLRARDMGLRVSRGRSRWLTEQGFEDLLGHTVKPVHRAILITAVETGMRKMEILELTRAEVDLKRRRIVLGNLDAARTKTSESRIIPLTPRAHEVLTTCLDSHSSSQVFINPGTGLPYTKIQDWWQPLARRAGLVDFVFHDLRHTFASWAIQRGIEERILQAWLGHKTRSMTSRYSHLREADLEAAAAKFAAAADVTDETKE